MSSLTEAEYRNAVPQSLAYWSIFLPEMTDATLKHWRQAAERFAAQCGMAQSERRRVKP